jgi:hypothetical protein
LRSASGSLMVDSNGGTGNGEVDIRYIFSSCSRSLYEGYRLI